MKILRILAVMAFALLVGALAGCTSPGGNSVSLKAPKHATMKQFATIKNLDPVKACVRPHVQGIRVALLPSIDNAEKGNAVSDSGTGKLLSGSQTATFVIPLLKKELGMKVQSLMNMSGELARRQYLLETDAIGRQKALLNAKAKYELDVAPLSLDFTQTSDLNGLLKGLGGYSNVQMATLSGGAKFLAGDGSMDIEGFGGMKMSLFSRQDGIVVARVFGNKLATGEAGIGVQQPTQLWSAEYVGQISTLMAVADLPEVPVVCTDILNKIVAPDIVDI